MYDSLLDAINGLLPTPITIGSMPPNNSASMYIGSGAPDSIHMDKGSLSQLSLVVNAKNSNQLTCLRNLSAIHEALTLRKDYPSSDKFEITNISTSTVPNYLGQENNSQHLYGSILRVDFYIKGVEC